MEERFNEMSLVELREAAKERNMKGVSTLRKPQLIEALVAFEAQNRPAVKEMPAAETVSVQEHAPAAEEKPVNRAPEQSAEQEAYQRRPMRRERTEQRNDRGERTERSQQDYRQNNRGQQDNRRYDRGQQDYRRQDSRQDYRQDNRQDNRQDYRQDNRQDSRQDYRQDNRQDSRQDYRQDNRQDNRQDYRQDNRQETRPPMDLQSLDSGNRVTGCLEVMPDGYGFIRSNNYMPGDNDVYVSPSQIRKFGLKTGDFVSGNTRVKAQQEKFGALLYVNAINGMPPAEGMKRKNFEDMTPIFPDQRIRLERSSKETAMRITDLISPIGKGQRGMIVSPPKAGKTTLLKDIARSILLRDPDMHLMILLIDERPEEVTDIREAIVGPNVEVLDSTFDETPEHHIRVAEMGLGRAKRLVEYGQDVTILLDSITRLARASNLTVQPSGRTLSGGLDPAALYIPKRFFGAARNMREGGSLTILATALVDTGSKMDDMVFEEFKGTGNMELVLDRKLSERRIFPAIDIQKSGTRREDLLLSKEEMEAVYIMRKALNGAKSEEAAENILNMLVRTKDNQEFVNMIRRQRFV